MVRVDRMVRVDKVVRMVRVGRVVKVVNVVRVVNITISQYQKLPISEYHMIKLFLAGNPPAPNVFQPDARHFDYSTFCALLGASRSLSQVLKRPRRRLRKKAKRTKKKRALRNSMILFRKRKTNFALFRIFEPRFTSCQTRPHSIDFW